MDKMVKIDKIYKWIDVSIIQSNEKGDPAAAVQRDRKMRKHSGNGRNSAGELTSFSSRSGVAGIAVGDWKSECGGRDSGPPENEKFVNGGAGRAPFGISE